MEYTKAVRNFVIDNFLFGEDNGLEENTSFLENGIIDSTGILELVTFLEETFSIVVEDEELVSNLLCKCLNKADYLTDAVFSAAETLEYLEKRSPDLILLDIGLPDDNGLNLLPLIKEMDEFISTVILTAQQDTATVVNAMQLGADSFLGKPFARDMLLETVAQVLDRHRALRHDWVNRRAHSSKYRL